MSDQLNPSHLPGFEAMAPTSSSYWIVENRLLAGAHPGSGDSGPLRRVIQALLAAGIRIFVDLTDTNDTDHEGMSLPRYDGLACDLCPTVSFHHFPIPDNSAPSIQCMVAVLDAIDQAWRSELPAYVHCWSGVGRTGTVIACWLLNRGLATRTDVFRILQQLRRQDRLWGYRESPETWAQRKFVLEWPLATESS